DGGSGSARFAEPGRGGFLAGSAPAAGVRPGDVVDVVVGVRRAEDPQPATARAAAQRTAIELGAPRGSIARRCYPRAKRPGAASEPAGVAARVSRGPLDLYFFGRAVWPALKDMEEVSGCASWSSDWSSPRSPSSRWRAAEAARPRRR